MALTNSQYDSIMKQYQLTQASNRLILEARKQEVYKCIPLYQELEAAVSQLSLEYTKYNLSDQISLMETTREKLSETIQKKEEVLMEIFSYIVLLFEAMVSSRRQLYGPRNSFHILSSFT